MTPENQSEGQGVDTPENVLFADSESATQDTPQQEAESEPQQAEVSEDTSPAEALDDPSPSDALDKEPAEGDAAKPESYKDFEIPEGSETQFSESVIAKFGSAAQEAGLNQEQAQKLIDALAPAQSEAQRTHVDDAIKRWETESREDAEIGGENYRSSLSNARRAVDRFGTPELKQLLTGPSTKLANHPEMLRLLARVGQAIGPDRSLVGGKDTKAKPDVNVVDPLSTPDATAELLFGADS